MKEEIVNEMKLRQDTVENVFVMKLRKRENLEKIPKSPNIAHHNCPGAPRMELGTPAGTEE